MTGVITTIARGDGSRITEPARLVVRTAAEWQSVWAAHAGADAPLPPVDFSARLVAAVFAGERPVPGFEVEIVGSRREGTALALLVEERRPASDAVAAQILVTPFHIATVPRYDGDGRLLVPEGFTRWILAGSSLGLSYSEGETGHEMYHFTLIEPTAYEHFRSTGTFREGTMLALLLHDIGSGATPARHGRYAARAMTLEMAVKVLMDELKANPPKRVTAPPAPDVSK